MSVEQNVTDVIVQTLSIKPQEIKLEEKLADSLGVDSTEMVDLKVAIEKKFNLKFAANEVTKFDSPREIINLIENKKSSS